MSEDILNPKTADPTQVMSYHIDFSDFLSFDEAVTSFCNFLDQFRDLANESILSETQHQQLNETALLLDRLSARFIALLQGKENLNPSKKSELVRAFNEYPIISVKTLNTKKNFQHLRFMLTSLQNYPNEKVAGSLIDGMPSEVFELLLNTSDEILSTQGVHFYKTKFIDQHSLENSRLQFAHVFLNTVRQNDMSDFKREFIVEWVFESALLNALLHDELIYTFVSILKDTLKNFGTDIPIMHGLLRALQKDHTTLCKSAAQKEKGFDSGIIERAGVLIEPLFPHLVSMAKEHLSFVSKSIVGFVFDLSVSKEDYRLFKWNQWRWVRMLATGSWDASLREPPGWVISGGSQYCAVIFDAAPPVWLKSYAYLLIERVYAETLVDGFMPTLQHYDYIEFLVRCLKKKSPHFSSHHDSYLVLDLLSRLTPREANKELNLKYSSVPAGNNVVNQALAVLLRMTRL